MALTLITADNIDTTTNPTVNAITVSTNTATIGTAAYFVANGNLGIGTSTPTSKLHVIGNTINSGVLITNLTSALNIGIVSNYATWQGSGTSDDLVVAGFGARNLILGTNAAERMRINSSGNVGIGSAVAGNILTVSGSSPYRAQEGSGTYYYDFGRDVSTGAFLLNGNQSGSVAYIWQSAGTERMRIDSSGNILIGSADAGNTLRYLDLQNANTGSSAGAIMRFITANVAGTGVTTVDIVKYKSGGFYINNNETNTAAFTGFNVGASERMRIDSSGNMGIGATPNGGFITGNRLEIKSADLGTTAGNISAPLLLSASDGNVTTLQTFNYRVSNGSSHNTAEYRTQRIVDITRQAYVGWGSDYLAFGTTNTERMRIDSSGRVTMPYQPSFSTYGGTNSTLTGTPLGLVFTSAPTNVGSNYSTTTGRFTAPVAGTYLFSWTLTQSTALTGPVSYLYKNGASSTAGVIAYGVAYNNATMNVILTLAASDYVQVYAVAFNSTSPVLDMSFMQFSGHLIG